jgi:hypothetical protein
MGLERGPLSLVKIIEELLGRHNGFFDLRNPVLTAVETHFADHVTRPLPAIFGTRFADRGGRLVIIVRSPTDNYGMCLFVILPFRYQVMLCLEDCNVSGI